MPSWGTAEVTAGLRSQPRRSGVLVDFDGVLAPIVDDPATAGPLPGVPDCLDRLAERYAVVGVVSGRPVSFLESKLPSRGVRLSGLYGLETSCNGRRDDHPSAGAWREVIADVAAVSEAHGPAGMTVESKGLSLTLHYRTDPSLGPTVLAWADKQAARSGLLARPAKMSVELHPPISVDKGMAVETMSQGLRAVCYLGDDIGDLPAFDALDRLEAAGAKVLRVGVRSDEAPGELIDRADLVVDGPVGAFELLESLLD